MGDRKYNFTVDPEDLLRVMGEMASCEKRLEGLATDLEKQVHLLHESWEGEAATAQRLAQTEWATGFCRMREALRGIRAAAQVAHGNYTGAATTNLEMWSQLR
jgi:WXG100 family type VII secretion target